MLPPFPAAEEQPVQMEALGLLRALRNHPAPNAAVSGARAVLSMPSLVREVHKGPELRPWSNALKHKLTDLFFRQLACQSPPAAWPDTHYRRQAELLLGSLTSSRSPWRQLCHVSGPEYVKTGLLREDAIRWVNAHPYFTGQLSRETPGHDSHGGHWR